MSAIKGLGAVVYLATSTSVAAVNLSEQTEYSIEVDYGTEDVTDLNSTWANHVPSGPMKWTASLNGNFDQAGKNLWTAATARKPLRFYLYPDVDQTTLYYYGMGWVRLGTAIAGGVNTAPKTRCSIQGEDDLFINP